MRLGYYLAGTALAVGAVTWIAGLLLGLFQCVLWLKDGYWTHFTPVRALGPIQSTGWGGVDQIVHWIWLQPLWAVICFSGMALIGLAGVAAQSYE